MLTYLLDEGDRRPKYEQLYVFLKDDILSGRLRAGERLPSKRSFAEHLGVSVVTVETAYELLLTEGYALSRPRSGFYVCDLALPHEAEPLSARLPEEPEEDLLEESSRLKGSEFPLYSWTHTMRQVMADYGQRLLERTPNAGAAELRNAIAGYLGRYRGMSVSPENIIVGAGAEYLYGLVAQLFGPGTVFGLEDPSYEKIRMVYEAHGGRCELLPMGRNGIRGAALRESNARVLHVTPFNSFPSGVTAPAAKRYEYIRWATQRGSTIVEDDFDSEFAVFRKPLESLYSMDGGKRVIYINTFSKSLAPSMRLGYMVLPSDLRERFREKLGFYSCTVPAFDQYALARFLDGGNFERYLSRVRRRLRQGETDRRP